MVAPLLFMSGMCALTYQTVWLREFRLIFGASTAATAAVLAIFMGGIGIGSVVLGRRADFHPRPLAFYGQLELLIASSAALTPMILRLVRGAYLHSGGSLVLGTGGATAVRLLAASLVLAIPALAMGGTLPAAARAVVTRSDAGRRRAAFIYGSNTLGAVAGALLSTFVLLERFGNTGTLWLACSVNALAAMIALIVSGRISSEAPAAGVKGAVPSAESVSAANNLARNDERRVIIPLVVLAAAAVSGFAFFLMEIVWYRMLAPLLGGSVFTFGLILAAALLGIGVGGLVYTFLSPSREPPLKYLGLTFALEGVCLGVPLALGDRLALLALSMRPVALEGFHMTVLAWAAVSAIVVLPPALVAGYQFPLLLAALGRGRDQLGKHVGLAYAWNTAGAIAGSLAGGFGLMPLLSAPGAWRLVVVLLALTSVCIILVSNQRAKVVSSAQEGIGSKEPHGNAADGGDLTQDSNAGADQVRGEWIQGIWGRYRAILIDRWVHLVAFAFAGAACITSVARGPTAVWRHSGIGVGRADAASRVSDNRLREHISFWRRTLLWERDGVESSVAVSAESALSFLVNGKNDGNARMDAGTAVMSGLLGAALHPNPVRAFVIGLGTGSTAGWLGAVESIERVDVAELEPAIVRVAEDCAAVNCNMPANPKIRLLVGDARELLAVSRDRYDIVMSEPSNPYRAGIASLFTREFYQAVRQKLTSGGLFLQWIQTYEIQPTDVENVCGTLASVFPVVEVWYTRAGDLFFACALEPIKFDADRLRHRIAQEPFRSALAAVWRVTDLEGFLAHYISSNEFAREIASSPNRILNTDDRTVMEFNCGRHVGRLVFLDAREWLARAARRGLDRPTIVNGTVDWSRLADARATMFAVEGQPPSSDGEQDPALVRRTNAKAQFVRNNLEAAMAEWSAQTNAPTDLLELLLVAESLADAGNELALIYAERLRQWQPIEADVVLARLRWRQRRFEDAVAGLERVFRAYRSNPWPFPPLMYRALVLAESVSKESSNPELARRLHAALKEPFAVHLWDQVRLACRFNVALDSISPSLLKESIESFEPHVPWRRFFLEKRLLCYEFLGDPRVARARRDLELFDKVRLAEHGKGATEVPRERPDSPIGTMDQSQRP